MADASRGEAALLTGATGFIGSHLAARLVELGWSVHVVVREGSDLAILSPLLDRIVVHHHDGGTESLVAIVAEAKPSIAFHLASNFLAQHTVADVAGLVRSNVLFSTQLVEALARNGVGRIVNTGTSWQHFENAAYRPVNLYAATKQCFEDVLAYYADACGLKATTLVIFDTYGPKDPRGKLVSLLWRTARSGRPIAMSPGEQKIDLVHIEDVVDAFVRAAELLPSQVEPTTRWGIASGRTLNLREIVTIFENVTGLKVPVEWGARSYRSREVMSPWSQYKVLPGWTAKIRLEEGIGETEP